MSTELKNILLAGATGSIGAPILSGLLAEPSFNVTILTRASSSARFPSGIPVKQVSDSFTVEELTQAFKGQDAVVMAISTIPVLKEDIAYRIIDAAVAAGVKRLIPSEFGANNLDPRATKLVPVYEAKGKMLEYLIKKAAETNGALTWTSIACGSWLDWSLDPAKSGNFLDINVKDRKVTIWDSGRSRFAATTITNAGLGVAKALLHSELTANKQVFLADFVTNTREIVESLEKQTASKFTVEEKESAPVIKELRDRFDAGDIIAAIQLVLLSVVADVDVGYDFETEQDIWNEKLGLPKRTLDDVVKGAIDLANSTGL